MRSQALLEGCVKRLHELVNLDFLIILVRLLEQLPCARREAGNLLVLSLGQVPQALKALRGVNFSPALQEPPPQRFLVVE
jgi:hypothetical protein